MNLYHAAWDSNLMCSFQETKNLQSEFYILFGILLHSCRRNILYRYYSDSQWYSSGHQAKLINPHLWLIRLRIQFLFWNISITDSLTFWSVNIVCLTEFNLLGRTLNRYLTYILKTRLSIIFFWWKFGFWTHFCYEI